MILGYAEMLKRITGVDQKALEKPYQILSRHVTSKKRLDVLKQLAKSEPASIGSLLKALGQNRGGGSYITIQNYFLELEKDGLLVHDKKWSFHEDYKDFKRFLM